MLKLEWDLVHILLLEMPTFTAQVPDATSALDSGVEVENKIDKEKKIDLRLESGGHRMS